MDSREQSLAGRPLSHFSRVTHLAREYRYTIHLLLSAAFGALATTLLYEVTTRSTTTTVGEASGMTWGKATQGDVVIDVDIGTFGSAIDRKADKLVTFDPFDSLHVNDSVERYPYVVSDFNGSSTFYVNRLRPSCSTMNIVNTFYSDRLRDKRIVENCGNVKLPMRGAIECAHPLAEHVVRKHVEVRRLCDLLKMRGYSRINKLKIDAQGTDFAILKDLVENCAHVHVSEIKLECQVYEKTIPLYMTDNDCGRIEAYVRQKFPRVVIKRELNVCWSGEFNLIMTNLSKAVA